MSVARLLLEKGREVLTVPPRATLQVVIDTLATNHVGSLVVVDTFGTMMGIVSERDVVRAIARSGSHALHDIVAEYMTTNVRTANETDDVDAVLQMMNDGRFRHVPIVERGRLVGLVSQGDAIKYRLDEMKVEQAALRQYILA